RGSRLWRAPIRWVWRRVDAGPLRHERTGGHHASHFALVHYGDGEMREVVLDFLRPALEDQGQAIYLCGPPGGASLLLRFLERSADRDLRDDVTKRRIVLGQGDRDADQQLQNLLDPVHELCERGFSPVRVVGPAAWNVLGYSAPED